MAGDWYVGRNGERSGPYTEPQFRRLAASGRIGPADLVWTEGMPAWVPASTIGGLLPGGPSAAAANPYAPPATTDLEVPVFPDAPDRTAEYADFLPRVVSFLIDAFILALLGCIPNAVINAVSLVVAGKDPALRDGATVLATALSQVVSTVIGVAYYVILETSEKQGTWGKQIVGIRVTDLEGRRITAGRAVARYFAKILTVCTCGIGLLMPLWTARKQTLHDMVCGCLALKP